MHAAVTKPFVDIVSHKPRVSGGKPLVCDEGECCGDACEPRLYEYGHPCDPISDLACMFAVADITFSSPEGSECDFSVYDGRYVVQCPPVAGDDCVITSRCIEGYELGDSCDACDFDSDGSINPCMAFHVGLECRPCEEGSPEHCLQVLLIYDGTEGVDEETRCDLDPAYGIFSMLSVQSGVTFTLDTLPEPSTSEGCACPSIASATVTFYGRRCADLCWNPPTVTFTATHAFGCRFFIEPTVTLGGCTDPEGVTCIWSDGHIGCEDRWVLLNVDCGEVEKKLTVWVFDEAGCMGVYSQTLECCSCEDYAGSPCIAECEEPPCAGVCLCNEEGDSLPTNLSWTQVDPEDDPCVYDFTADGNCGGIALCGLIPSGSLCVCEAFEDDPEYWGDLCLGCEWIDAGTTKRITLPGGCSNLSWRVAETPCGCFGEANEFELCCNECECCTGPLGGAIVTLSGLGGPEVGCEGSGCDGSPANKAYDVPITGECMGEATFLDVGGECPDGTPLNVDITWSLSCEGDEVWLYLGVTVYGVGILATISDEVLVGTKPITCSDIAEELTNLLNSSCIISEGETFAAVVELY